MPHGGLRAPVLFLGCLLGLFIINSGLRAEDETAKKPKNVIYSSETSLSLVQVKGNNNSTSYSVDTNHKLEVFKNLIDWQGRMIHSRSDGEKTAEIYYTHLKYDRMIGSRAHLLGFTRYERNILAGYNYRVAVSFGGGINWLKKEHATLLSELAFGWNNEQSKRLPDLSKVNTGNLWKNSISTSFPTSILINRLSLRISKASEMVLRSTIFVNLEDIDTFRLNNYASVSATISPKLALKTSIELIYENVPVPGFKHTDTYLLSSLVIRI
jgi:hypothetical protein